MMLAGLPGPKLALRLDRFSFSLLLPVRCVPRWSALLLLCVYLVVERTSLTLPYLIEDMVEA